MNTEHLKKARTHINLILERLRNKDRLKESDKHLFLISATEVETSLTLFVEELEREQKREKWKPEPYIPFDLRKPRATSTDIKKPSEPTESPQ